MQSNHSPLVVCAHSLSNCSIRSYTDIKYVWPIEWKTWLRISFSHIYDRCDFQNRYEIGHLRIYACINGVYSTSQYRFWSGDSCNMTRTVVCYKWVCECLLVWIVCSRNIYLNGKPCTVWTKKYSDFIIWALGSKHFAINMNLMIESLKCDWIECMQTLMWQCSIYTVYLRAYMWSTAITLCLNFNFSLCAIHRKLNKCVCPLSIEYYFIAPNLYRGQSEQVFQFVQSLNFFFSSWGGDDDGENNLECENWNIVLDIQCVTLTRCWTHNFVGQLMPCCLRSE